LPHRKPASCRNTSSDGQGGLAHPAPHLKGDWKLIVRKGTRCLQGAHCSPCSQPVGAASICREAAQPVPSMNNTEALSNLQHRLTAAGRRADLLRQVGTQDQYLESYFLVEALELQLDALVNDKHRSTAS